MGQEGVDGDEDQAGKGEDQGLGLPPANVRDQPSQDEGEAGGQGPWVWPGLLTNSIRGGGKVSRVSRSNFFSIKWVFINTQ